MVEESSHDKNLQAMPAGVHVAPPTLESAERLWQCYQQAYRNDDDLLIRTCSTELGIDGLTESLTATDIGEAMQTPDTVTLEVGSPDGSGCGGFVMVRYASEAAESKERFRRYFLGDVFPQNALRFRNGEDQNRFSRALDDWPVAYFAEFVSLAGRRASASLVVAAYQEVCVRRLKTASCAFVGKCLDSVQIGCCTNLRGNRPVKALAEALGLENIAQCDQVRHLDIVGHEDLLTTAFPGASTGSHARIPAVLTFALYFGDARLAVEKIIERQSGD